MYGKQETNTVIPTTNTIINIKSGIKDFIKAHYKQHIINNTLYKFRNNFCINNILCKMTGYTLMILL